ncbi:hypothetical protein D6T51_07895 [Salmonella enterica subsp. enterica serovar Muenchen]|uniref:Uncharacterized protein n=1 Tax=Salmonella enterica subsp. enterica serovar Ank TaxID=1173578 RepID=A0A726Y030_SALET|nr:hypothetical protein [Salmonella enterica subsp. enterica serovar Muenchen]HAE1794674.1 hypothetical protein [Salmonella enterica subsp. enterica serovar Ank]
MPTSATVKSVRMQREMSEMGTVNIKCPECGHTFVLMLSARIRYEDAVKSAPCPECGCMIGGNHILSQMREHARELLRDTVRHNAPR